MKKLKSLYHFLSKKRQTIHLDYPVHFKPRFGHGSNKTKSALYPIIDANREEYASLLNLFNAYGSIFQQIKLSSDETDENQPAWNNEFLPGLDIIALYALVAEFKPKQYIEVGSGNSTKVVRKAIVDNKLVTEITSIDPFPRANIDHLANNVLRLPIENMEDHSVFKNLEAGDILFIDNSHRALPNSDVTVCFLEILPVLKPGVIVHVHDIYIPYDYPQFMCDRAYSEQYVLAAFILANPKKYKTIMPNYFVSEDKELREILSPIWAFKELDSVERHGGSFWFQIQE
jgi:hypothetical protein